MDKIRYYFRLEGSLIMKQFSYVIKEPVGLHARPAGLLVRQANEYHCSITLKSGDKTADAKKILAVTNMGVTKGQEVIFLLEGEEEEKACEELKKFMEENL